MFPSQHPTATKKLNNIELLSIETSPGLLLRIKGLGVHFKMMAIWTKNVVYGLSLFMIRYYCGSGRDERRIC